MDIFEFVVLCGILLGMLTGAGMILQAKASNFSVRGGVLMICCSALGLWFFSLESSTYRGIGIPLVAVSMSICSLVHTYAWRDAASNGDYRPPGSMLSILGSFVRRTLRV
jgi:hypothetical protein